MKHFLMGFFLCTSLAHAKPLVTIKNFNFTYQDPHGQGKADAFTRSFKSLDEAVHVTVDKNVNDFIFSVSGAEEHQFELKNAPGLLIKAQEMNVTGLNLNVDQQFSLSLGSASFISPGDTFKLNGFSLQCNKVSSYKEILDQLISGCVQKMTMKSSKFSSSEAEESLAFILNQSFTKIASSVTVNSVDFKITGGKFDLSAEVKAQVSGRVKGNGNISFDFSKRVLAVKISEVKFGFLNITNKVFDELKKQESRTLSVKQPYVYYLVE